MALIDPSHTESEFRFQPSGIVILVIIAAAVLGGIYGAVSANGTVIGVSATVLAILVTTLAFGVWVGVALISVGIISLAMFRSMPVEKLLAQLIFNVTTTPELIALPLFIFMAEILFHSKLSASLFTGLAPWTNRLPGRLLHVKCAWLHDVRSHLRVFGRNDGDSWSDHNVGAISARL